LDPDFNLVTAVKSPYNRVDNRVGIILALLCGEIRSAGSYQVLEEVGSALFGILYKRGEISDLPNR